MVTEDEELAVLIQSGKVEAVLKNEKIQAFIKEEFDIKDNPFDTEIRNVTHKRTEINGEKDKTRRPFFKKIQIVKY